MQNSSASSQPPLQSTSSSSTSAPGEASNGRRTKSGNPASLNPNAVDFVPTASTSTSAHVDGGDSTNANTGAANGRSRGNNNRRQRKPANQESGGNGTGSSQAANGHGSQSNRRSRGAAAVGGAGKGRQAQHARIDDQADDVIINMDRPSSADGQPPRQQQQQQTLANSGRDRRRNDQGNRSTNTNPEGTAESGSQNKNSKGGRQNNNTNNNRNRNRGGQEGSSSAGNNGTNNNGGGRQARNNLDGRRMPKIPLGSDSHAGHAHAEGTSSPARPGRNTNANNRRAPAKHVHTVEEDRDLMEALTVGLTESTYDCMVCWDIIRPAHKVWNCQVCWAAFHLNCITTWATKSSEESSIPASGWRCPGCQNTQVSIPRDYACFCGKVQNPEFNRYFTPHSCGDSCGRSRDCPHPCNLPCHPGPCPPCGGQGPTQYCHCGNETFQSRCADTDFTGLTGKSCSKVCDELLGCGKHTCKSVCHAGLCAPCEEEQTQPCYCGKHERVAKCGDGEPRTTIKDGQEHTGFYECHDVCNTPLACGHHNCTKPCHPLDDEPGQCSAMPETVKTCPCGSKSIETLLGGKSRTSCLDPIPVCSGVCKKQLPCGHRCMQKCHLGECKPCRISVQVDCRCGSTRLTKVCCDLGLLGDNLPTCDRPCHGLRGCGKHRCTTKCCPAKNLGKAGSSSSSAKVDPAAFEAHTCTLTCGKKLQCGVHTCEMLCHKGYCNPCMNASFEELSCSCGRTVLYPPIACGTKIPKCKYTCNRPRTCGHMALSNHPCHPDSEPCPPCIMLVPKSCMCKKSRLPNVPCYKANPSCGKTCGKKLDCGHHNCLKTCHSGDCMTGEDCQQACPKIRKSCSHRCGATCHGDTECPEDVACPVLVPASCKCGNLAMDMACNATAENPWDFKPRMLKCNDYCLTAERNKRIALALEIEDPDRVGPKIPEYTYSTLDYALANFEFAEKTEANLKEWMGDASKTVLRLPPMKGHRRKYLHEIAGYYDLISESEDVEPYRSVTMWKKSTSRIPDLLPTQAARQKRAGTFVPASSSSSGTTPSSTTGSGSGGLEQMKRASVKNPVNAVYLHDLAFGLTRTDLAKQLAPIFGHIKFGMRWVTDDDAVLVPHPGSMQMDELEDVLIRLRNGIKTVSAKTGLAGRVELCWVNKEGEVVSGSSTNLSQANNRRFFSSSTVANKPAPAKVHNPFAMLDDEERLAAAKKAEEEKMWKERAAAGTLSTEAWEEAPVKHAPMPIVGAVTSSSVSVLATSFSDATEELPDLPPPTEDLNRFVVVEDGLFTDEVVDDWQELIEDDEEVTKESEEGIQEISAGDSAVTTASGSEVEVSRPTSAQDQQQVEEMKVGQGYETEEEEKVVLIPTKTIDSLVIENKIESTTDVAATAHTTGVSHASSEDESLVIVSSPEVDA